MALFFCDHLADELLTSCGTVGRKFSGMETNRPSVLMGSHNRDAALQVACDSGYILDQTKLEQGGTKDDCCVKSCELFTCHSDDRRVLTSRMRAIIDIDQARTDHGDIDREVKPGMVERIS